MVRYIPFFTLAFLILGAGHVYLYRRLVRDTTQDVRLRRFGLLVTVLLAMVLIVGRILQRLAPGTFSDVVAGVGYVWMGVALFLFLTLLSFDAVRGVQHIVRRFPRQRPSSTPAASGSAASVTDPVDPSRRLFLARASAGTAAAIASSASGYGAWRAYHPPSISEVVLKVPKLPRTLEGFTIVQLTDIHVGNLIERRFLDELVRVANSAKPDLVAITGDLVDGGVDELGRSVAALRGLKSRFGSYFVTGNHEYYAGVREWTAFLLSVGVQVLRNRRVPIGDGGGTFDLIGVDDWRGGRFTGEGTYDLDAAIAGRDPDKAAVLLAHQPANFDVARTKGVDVQLSGHTHGGQLFPLTFLVGLGWEYSAGHYERDGAHIYVSRGCGFWGPPMRVGSPPEVVKVVLTT
ncbi:MAG: metallophosphoesterase [Myxococcaceae bacterium]|nr:metallophosphoesterase [Myxococcaceae bacterium]